MTHIDKRKSLADAAKILNSLLKGYDSVSIDVDKDGMKVRVWEKEQGNRRPIAFASRKCLGDAVNDIEKDLKS
jgi:hypothetical protein